MLLILNENVKNIKHEFTIHVWHHLNNKYNN